MGVKIHRDRSRKLPTLSQESYIERILENFKMDKCKPMDTPISKGQTLSFEMCPKTSNEQNEMTRVPYSNAVRSLIYAMMCTRPNNCYVVGLVSKAKHWNTVKKILTYLKGTTDYSLCYQGDDLRLIGYTDVDWGGDLDERKSTSGYVFLLSRDVISWSSKKQTRTTLSTMEAEYVAC